MLSLTKKTGYALVAISHLTGLEDGERASSREIANAYNIPASLLMNVLKELAGVGYVESTRGAHGGYRLCINPEDVTLADLAESIEGPVRMAECITKDVGEAECTCQIMANCPVADPVHRVHRKLRDFLSTISLAELVVPGSLAAAAGRKGAEK